MNRHMYKVMCEYCAEYLFKKEFIVVADTKKEAYELCQTDADYYQVIEIGETTANKGVIFQQ